MVDPIKNPPSDTAVGKYLTATGYLYYCNSPTNAFFVEAGFYKQSLRD
jgi:hypothetical protein